MNKSREWKLRSEDTTDGIRSNPDFLRLQKETGLSPLTVQVCWTRGLRNAETIQAFFQPRLDTLQSPFTIKDMDIATERVADAFVHQEKIRVYGDYDVDGTCGAAILYRALTDFGINVEARQPDRFKDGYGLNTKAVEDAHAEGAQLMITVDCGITSFAALERAEELGLPVIIIDHHQIDQEQGMPKAFAILNPQRADCESGLKQLCGAGVAFYFLMGLRSVYRENELLPPEKLPNLKQHLDLVTIATAADQVPITGANRTFVKHGLDMIKQSTKPGVRALMDVTGLSKKDLSPGHLGFTLAPRINASGRIQNASLALDLLTTKNPEQAWKIARYIERLNDERMELQNQIWDEVQKTIEMGLQEGRYQHGIAVGSANWHEGVIGIVASRICEKYHKPAAIFAVREDMAKGSVRTWAGRDVLSALQNSAQFLKGFGGHRHAAGFSMDLENIENFVKAFDDACSNLVPDENRGALMVEGKADLSEFTSQALTELEQMGPFGNGNPEPVFVIQAEVASHRVLKERHLKLQLSPVGAETKQTMEAVWFHQAELPETQSQDSEIAEWAGVPELNRFMGRSTPNFRIKDFRKRIQ